MKPQLLAALQEELARVPAARARAGSGPVGRRKLKLLLATDLENRPFGATRALATPEELIFLAKESEGAFSEVYREVRSDGEPERAFAFTAESEDKDILAEAKRRRRNNPYLPAVRKIGVVNQTPVYEMPFYDVPPVADDEAQPDPEWWGAGQAQVESSKLQFCKKDALGRQVQLEVQGEDPDGKQIIIDCMQSDAVSPVDPDLIDALVVLREVANKRERGGVRFGFEFPDRNLATDKNGHLVLLDPVFPWRKNF